MIPVRGGALAPGSEQCAEACDGRVLLVGTDTAAAARGLVAAEQVWACELGTVAPGRWAEAVARLLDTEPLHDAGLLLLPASADGRDAAPRLAARLGWPLWAGATWLGSASGGRLALALARHGARSQVELLAQAPAVVTVTPQGREQVGRAQTGPDDAGIAAFLIQVRPVLPPPTDAVRDARSVGVSDDDQALELAWAETVLVGGGGLGQGRSAGAAATSFRELAAVGAALGAAVGGTRVAADAGWVGGSEQIGTTGVQIHPRRYVGFGVSGAVQHLAGIGRPELLVAVTTDPASALAAAADLVLVCDAPALVAELARQCPINRATGIDQEAVAHE